MKKIITAIGEENLNKKLREESTFEIISNDIQYREGILEFLEKNNNIDFLILSELLQGEIELKELIKKIKIFNSNIKIILFLENKNEELEDYLYAKGVYFIFYNNQIKVTEIIELLKNEKQDSNLDLKRELEELKQLLLKKEEIENKKSNFLNKIKIIIKNILKNNIKQNLKDKEKYIIEKNDPNYLHNENRFNNESDFNNKESLIYNNKDLYSSELKIINNKNEIICITGTSGVGKSIFSINLAKSFMENKNKILIIDFDILNNSLHTILGIKRYSEKIKSKIKNNNLLEEIHVEDLIIKVNSKIDLISGINILFDSKYKISSTKIKTILQTLKDKYDVIIIDTSSECFYDYTKEIIKNSNINIFITEANLLEIKKAKKLLNIYINNWEIPKESFNILFNKYNENSIDISILKNIFSDFTILGKLSINTKYDLFINKNNVHHLEKELRKEYIELNKKILKESN